MHQRSPTSLLQRSSARQGPHRFCAPLLPPTHRRPRRLAAPAARAMEQEQQQQKQQERAESGATATAVAQEPRAKRPVCAACGCGPTEAEKQRACVLVCSSRRGHLLHALVWPQPPAAGMHVLRAAGAPPRVARLDGRDPAPSGSQEDAGVGAAAAAVPGVVHHPRRAQPQRERVATGACAGHLALALANRDSKRPVAGGPAAQPQLRAMPEPVRGVLERACAAPSGNGALAAAQPAAGTAPQPPDDPPVYILFPGPGENGVAPGTRLNREERPQPLGVWEQRSEAGPVVRAPRASLLSAQTPRAWTTSPCRLPTWSAWSAPLPPRRRRHRSFKGRTRSSNRATRSSRRRRRCPPTCCW